jgi:uncharacterized protein
MFKSHHKRRFALAFASICICVALGWAIAPDPRVMLTNSRASDDGPSKRPPGRQMTDPTASLVAGILGSLDDEWKVIFDALGLSFRGPHIVLYTSSTDAAGCGRAERIMGPFYCPDDEKVYLDTSFFKEIEIEYHGCDVGSSACASADAYVIAHEIGHHVQNLLGVLPRVRKLQRTASSRAESNALQVRLELQADCLAGVWAYRVNRRGWLEPTDIAAAIKTTEALGNDTLQRSAFGYVVPDSFTHGSASQRHQWFNIGFTTGSVVSCNPFAEASVDH